MRTVILYLFKRNCCNNEFEYQVAVNLVFKDRLPTVIKNCPSFSEKKLEEILVDHYLTSQGLYALKKILVVLKENFFFLEYSPMIPVILSLLLLFLSEAEAYCCMKSMLEVSKSYLSKSTKKEEEKWRYMRWYFTLEPKQFVQLCDTFFEGVQASCHEFKKILAHFKNEDFPYMNQSCKTVLKIFLSYLNEGVRVYFRVAYGICFMIKDEILLTKKNDLPNLFRGKTENFTLVNSHQLLRISYALTLKTHLKSKNAVNSQPQGRKLQKSRTFFRPRFNQSSEIVGDDKIETLWEFLPRNIKLNDAFLLFSTRKDGFSLQNLYAKCESYRDKPMVLILKNSHDWIFGAFCDENLSLSNDGKSFFRGSSATFVFSLSPIEKKFDSTGENSDHLRCDYEYFSFGGGGDGPAFSVDQELNNGHTYRSATYKNLPFNGCFDSSSFQLLDLELFVLE